ncbi:MAG: hypothetical protein KKA97_01205 [Actinobacteria bacterium]|nr:hypothetical protein [Actinomycetota bacterium]
MTRRVFLHIGAPKTGTTYLQDRLRLNSRSLAAHDVHFPSRNLTMDPPLFHFRAALDLMGQDWGGEPGHAEGSWDALVRRIKRLDGTIVVSHEILAAAHPAAIAKAKASLGRAGAELHVVYSARDLGRQIPAAWQESIKQGRTWSYRRFTKRIVKRNSWFSRAFDLPEVLTAWSEGLAPERVHVVTVPHTRGPALWERNCSVFGIDPAWAPKESEAHNASLGVAETAMLRRLNQQLDREPRQDNRFDVLVRRLLAEETLVQRRRSKPLLLPPHAQEWAELEAERWIDWIEGSRVHVAGDVADLRPAPRDPEAAWVNPDKVGSKPQLKAAMEALAAMTIEASRREDPQDTLAAKVRTRVRGLRDD